EPAHRNQVAGDRLAGIRFHQPRLGKKGGEVAATLRRRGYKRRAGSAQIALDGSLIATKEKQLVFDHWPSERATELVSLDQVVAGGEEISGVQRAISEEVEGAAVELIRARFRDHIHDGASGVAVLGAESVGLHAEFFERVRVRSRIVDVQIWIAIA